MVSKVLLIGTASVSGCFGSDISTLAPPLTPRKDVNENTVCPKVSVVPRKAPWVPIMLSPSASRLVWSTVVTPKCRTLTWQRALAEMVPLPVKLHLVRVTVSVKKQAAVRLDICLVPQTHLPPIPLHPSGLTSCL